MTLPDIQHPVLTLCYRSCHIHTSSLAALFAGRYRLASLARSFSLRISIFTLLGVSGMSSAMTTTVKITMCCRINTRKY